MSYTSAAARAPSTKLGLAILIAALLSIPLFSVWLMVYDRQQQSVEAMASIATGWGGPQTIAGPLLVIPYRTNVTETVNENGKQVTHTRQVWQELTLSPETVDLATNVRPERRKRSIYEVVVYDAAVTGKAHFVMPADLARSGVAPADLAFDRAELRFGISDPRGLAPNPRILAAGKPLRLQPGGGIAVTAGGGFFAWLDAASLSATPIDVDFTYGVRGNGSLSLAPQAGETRWRLRSAWASPSFQGGFLPESRTVSSAGFDATYRIGNLALGQSLIATGPATSASDRAASRAEDSGTPDALTGNLEAGVSLIQPVDLYSQVDRAVKYGFLFIGFTFLAFLLFDLIGGVPVSAVEYLLVGAALILFFALLLAFAEVIGFTPAYLAASAAIVGLDTAYSAAVLGSWRRAAFIFGLLTALYGVLYILLSLEAFSLLIGSLLLFAALAAVMYLTRNLNWGGRAEPEAGA
ncbi:MAG: inner membrane protein [Sphingomonadales bacterium]|jgi:inner membrane protein|nr:inner membrane protein [Sphingomonadales bacterium]